MVQIQPFPQGNTAGRFPAIKFWRVAQGSNYSLAIFGQPTLFGSHVGLEKPIAAFDSQTLRLVWPILFIGNMQRPAPKEASVVGAAGPTITHRKVNGVKPFGGP